MKAQELSKILVSNGGSSSSTTVSVPLSKTSGYHLRLKGANLNTASVAQDIVNRSRSRDNNGCTDSAIFE